MKTIKVLVYKENEFNHELLHRETIDITCYKTGTEHTIVCPTPYGDLEIKLGSSYQRTGGAFKWTCVVNPHSKIGYPLTFGPQVVVDRNLPWAGTWIGSCLIETQWEINSHRRNRWFR